MTSPNGPELDSDREARDERPDEPVPRSLKIFIAVLALLMALFIAAHLAGKGMGSHG